MTLNDLALQSPDAAGALQSLGAVRRAVAETDEPTELKGLRDYAESWRDFLKRRGDHLELQNEAAEVKIEAEVKLGAHLANLTRGAPGRPRKNQETQLSQLQAALTELSISDTTQREWEWIARFPEESRRRR